MKIRTMMRTEGIISSLDHKLWLSNLKFSKLIFFIVYSIKMKLLVV